MAKFSVKVDDVVNDYLLDIIYYKSNTHGEVWSKEDILHQFIEDGIVASRVSMGLQERPVLYGKCIKVRENKES